MDDMKTIVVCKHCKQKEFYGNMTFLSGNVYCRPCYMQAYEIEYGQPYRWTDKLLSAEDKEVLGR